MTTREDKRYTAAVAARFLSKVNKTDTCWIWSGCKNSSGYGIFYAEGRNIYAHRFSFELSCYKPKKFVLHKCDNKICVNPSHLYIGDAKQNARDAMERGQIARGKRNGAHTVPESILRGERHPNAKLNNSIIIKIRDLYDNHGIGSVRQSKIFGINRTIIERIYKRKTWKHV